MFEKLAANLSETVSVWESTSLPERLRDWGLSADGGWHR